MKINSFILCEDIRNEMGGKQSLMGVFGDTILLEVPPAAQDTWPKALRLGLYVQMTLEGDDRGIDNLSFKIEKDAVSGIGKIGEGTIPIWKNKSVGRLAIAFVLNPFLVAGAGLVTFKLICFGDDGKEIDLQGNSITVRIDQKVIGPQ